MREHNPKNTLQEFLQSRGLPLPNYVSEIVGHKQHAPLWGKKPQWRTTITLYDGRTFQSNPCSNRHSSEIEAAYYAYRVLAV